jgi:hypothetical protein
MFKFTFLKDRQPARNKRSELKGTRFNFHEFRRLVPLMKKVKEDGKFALISYDTLYGNGKLEDAWALPESGAKVLV